MIHFIISFHALLTPFPKTFIIKGKANPPFSPFPNIAFITEEATDSINEEAIGAANEAAISAIIAPKNSLFRFFFHAHCSSSTISY